MLEDCMVKCVCVCVRVCYLLSLEFLELGTRNGQLFWRLLLSQLLHLCLQGGQLLLQSLRDKNRLRRELKLGQNTNNTKDSIWNVQTQSFFINREKPTPQLSSLLLSCCLVLPVDSPPLILASHPSLGSYTAKWHKGSSQPPTPMDIRCWKS